MKAKKKRGQYETEPREGDCWRVRRHHFTHPDDAVCSSDDDGTGDGHGWETWQHDRHGPNRGDGHALHRRLGDLCFDLCFRIVSVSARSSVAQRGAVRRHLLAGTGGSHDADDGGRFFQLRNGRDENGRGCPDGPFGLRSGVGRHRGGPCTSAGVEIRWSLQKKRPAQCPWKSRGSKSYDSERSIGNSGGLTLDLLYLSTSFLWWQAVAGMIGVKSSTA